MIATRPIGGQLEAGLHYNWWRHYDPTLGRYTQPDPLGLGQGPAQNASAGTAPVPNGTPGTSVWATGLSGTALGRQTGLLAGAVQPAARQPPGPARARNRLRRSVQPGDNLAPEAKDRTDAHSKAEALLSGMDENSVSYFHPERSILVRSLVRKIVDISNKDLDNSKRPQSGSEITYEVMKFESELDLDLYTSNRLVKGEFWNADVDPFGS